MRRIRQFLASILVVALMAVLVNHVSNVSAHEMDTEGKLTENVSEFLVPDIVTEETEETQYVDRAADLEMNLNTFVFKNADGTNTIKIYDFPVKYVDDEGNIKDISTDIVKTINGNYKTKDNAINTTFSKKISDGITIENDEVEITMLPEVKYDSLIQVESEVDGGIKTVSYAYDEYTSLEYSLTYTGFKEDIVVEQYTGQTEYTFTLYTNGLYVSCIDGSYYLTNSSGDVKGTIGDIIIFTADERNNALGSMSATTICPGEQYLLTIHIDDEYLKDENTLYPIRIDPTIEISSGTGVIEDVTINSTGGTSGTSSSLYVGKRENYGISRILMKFSSLNLDNILTSDLIISAKVCIRDLLCEEDSLMVNCHIFTGNEWSETTATWENVNADSYGYSFQSNTVSYANGVNKSPQHTYSFDITKAVKWWKNGTQSLNKGLIFIAHEPEATGSLKHKTFGSYNRSSYQPSFELTYDYHTNINWGTITARGSETTGNFRVFSFSPATTGTYYIETHGWSSDVYDDTVLKLYDSNYELISSNDNISSTDKDSQIIANLTAGKTYKVILKYNSYGTTSNSYFIIYKSGTLYRAGIDGTAEAYSLLTKNFIKKGNYTQNYNCLAYAIGITNTWVWPWGTRNPSLSETTTYLETLGYERANTYSANCIVAYGTSTSNITHFSKVSGGVVVAKCGSLELLQHTTYQAYYTDSYGSAQAFYVKTTNSTSQESISMINSFNTDYLEYLNSICGDAELTHRIEKILNDFQIESDLANSYRISEECLAFVELEEIGTECIPYLLRMVLDSDSNGSREAFAVSMVNKLLGNCHLIGEIGDEEILVGQYVKYSPKWYALQSVYYLYSQEVQNEER